MNVSLCLFVALFGCTVAFPVGGKKDMMQNLKQWVKKLPDENDKIYIIRNVHERGDDVKKSVPMTEGKGYMGRYPDIQDKAKGKNDHHEFVKDLLDVLESMKEKSNQVKEENASMEVHKRMRFAGQGFGHRYT